MAKSKQYPVDSEEYIVTCRVISVSNGYLVEYRLTGGSYYGEGYYALIVNLNNFIPTGKRIKVFSLLFFYKLLL